MSRHTRVYSKHNAYYFVDRHNKWHRLCALSEGEAKMLRELAKLKDAPTGHPGSMKELIGIWRTKRLAKYAPSTRDDYELLLPKIEMAFEGFDVADVHPADVQDFLDQWADKPRQANKYRHVLSMMFKMACAPLRLRRDNPCDQVDTFDTEGRTRYIEDAELLKIRHGAMIGKDNRKVASGEIIVCAIDLAYLTFQRQAEIRGLKWADMDDEWINFQPGKTKSSTGARVRWRRTAAINEVLERARTFGKIGSMYVIHTLKGGKYTKSGIYTAWKRACERAKVLDANFHDLRGKAQTDAKAAGYTMEQIQNGATHASVTTTEGYIKRRATINSVIEMAMPKEKKK
jgi:integrase